MLIAGTERRTDWQKNHRYKILFEMFYGPTQNSEFFPTECITGFRDILGLNSCHSPIPVAERSKPTVYIAQRTKGKARIIRTKKDRTSTESKKKRFCRGHVCVCVVCCTGIRDMRTEYIKAHNG